MANQSITHWLFFSDWFVGNDAEFAPPESEHRRSNGKLQLGQPPRGQRRSREPPPSSGRRGFGRSPENVGIGPEPEFRGRRRGSSSRAARRVASSIEKDYSGRRKH